MKEKKNKNETVERNKYVFVKSDDILKAIDKIQDQYKIALKNLAK